MKKRLFAISAAVMLIICLVVPAAAQTIESSNDMWVTFGADGKKEMTSSFKDAKEIDDFLSDYLQPGDTAVFKIKLKNEYPQEVDWWMENRIIYSLEERSNNEDTKNGGYEYVLTYTNPEGESRYLFNSKSVGGEGSEEGLNEVVADRDTEEAYFYLDSYKQNESAYLTLEVSLDGESQGNDYQDTLADMGMNFAVELTEPETVTTAPEQTTTPGQTTTAPQKTTTPHSVKTGDDTNTTIYFVILAAAGVIILIFAILMVKKRRKGDAQ